ncbi:hypothetical protein [Bacteroides coprosuis]|uniref:hypothetical protein n=1 Tax=Bacteroides coprosuis TaxID=151276 RepID=UPI001D59CCD7|nr:hypothetical protein [Bacteroides coprosuis]HJD91300.1 hypothetical protein [Bacteroides coprosuis]
MKRGSGKTTMIKGIILSKNYKCILLVPDKSFIKRFDDLLFMNGKIFTFSEFMDNTDLIKGKENIKTIIIEEGFLGTPREILQLYFHIGCFFPYSTDIQVFGTPVSDEVAEENNYLRNEVKELNCKVEALKSVLIDAKNDKEEDIKISND